MALKAGPRKLDAQEAEKNPTESWVFFVLESWDVSEPPYKAGVRYRSCPQKAGSGGLQPPESWMSQYASFSGAKSWV